jgi:hypothetical protein
MYMARRSITGHRVAVETADLLKIGELGDLHAVAPDLPAEAPGAQGRALPIVLDETQVVHGRVDAQGVEALEVEFLEVVRRWLDDDLELIEVLHAVGIVAVAPIGRPPRRLHIGRLPGLAPKGAERGRRVEGAGAHLHVVGLQQDAALARPIALQGEDKVLE